MKFVGLLLLVTGLNCFAVKRCGQHFATRVQEKSSQLEVFSDPIEALDYLSRIESEVFELERIAQLTKAPANSFYELAQALRLRYEENIALIGIEPIEKTNKQLTKFQLEFIRLKKEFEDFEKARKIVHLYELHESPTIVLPDKIYLAEIHTGEVLAFSFSKKVVEEVFHSHSDLRKSAVKMSLRAMMKGIIPAYSKGANGIKIVNQRELIFEVAIIGPSIGQFRFLGFIDKTKNVFRVIHFYESSDHGIRNLEHQIDLVLQKKRAGTH